MATSEKLEKELESLKFGDHLACIYKTRKEQLSIVVPFILTGLKNNEKCIYIADENTKQEIIEAFKKVTDIDKYIKKNQLELLTKEEAYLKDGYFDPDRMIELLSQNEKKALKNRYKGLRVTGEMTWIFTKLPGVERLIEYEAKLNYFFPKSKCSALCQYNEGKFDPEILLDVIHNHPKLIIYDTLYENPHFLSPDEFFARMKGKIYWNTYEKVRDNIIERKKIKEKAEKREKERNLVLESISEPVLYYDRDKKIKWVNKAAAEFFNAEPEDLTGKICYKVLHNKKEPCDNCPVYRTWESGMYEEDEVPLIGRRIGHVKANPVYENGDLVGVVEVVEDITERKRTEMQLKNLFEASRSINSTMDMEELFRFISDSVQELVGFDNFIIFLGSEDRKRVYPAYAEGEIKHFLEELTFYYGEGSVGSCMITKETVLAESAHKETPFDRIMNSQIVVPLVIEDECVGVLHISRSASNAYSQHDAAVLQPLSEIISSALKNSKLHTEIKQLNEELEHRVEEKSKRTEILLNTRQVLEAERSWEKGLETIGQSVGKFGFETCGIFLVDTLRKTLDLHKDFHFGEEVSLAEEGTSIPLRDPDYFGVRCIREKRIIFVKDAASAEGKQVINTKSFVWVPIIVHNEALAAIAAGNISENPITDEDIKDLGILAGMCAAFIDRTRVLVEPAAENPLKTEREHWLDTAECYIVLEVKPEKSFEIFYDLVTHGVPGFVVSRIHPEKIKRKYKFSRTPLMWLTRSEIENSLSPDDLSKLSFVVEDFTRKSEESVILLDGIEYLIAQNGFETMLKYLHELKDIVVSGNSRLIIPLHKDTLSREEYSALERECAILEK